MIAFRARRDGQIPVPDRLALQRGPSQQLEALRDLRLGEASRPLQASERRENFSVDVRGGEQALIAQTLRHRAGELIAAEQIDNRRSVDDAMIGAGSDSRQRRQHGYC